MRPACGLMIFLVCSSLVVGAAQAQAMPAETAVADDLRPSWGFEVRAGPYRPRVSPDEQARKFFRLLYPADDSVVKHRPLLTTLEFTWFLHKTYGLLGLGLSVGYWNADGSARRCDDEDNRCTPATVMDSTAGNTPVTFTVVPLSLGVTYRMDLIKRYWSVPLVVYGKGGLDYGLWWAKTDGVVATSGEAKGQGGTFGFHAAAGLLLNLDWIEPEVSGRALGSTGLVDSYLFVELSGLWANNFGDGRRFDLSATVVAFGLAVDFL